MHAEEIDSASILIESYAEAFGKLKMEREKDSPLSQRDRACVGFGSWYQFYEKVTSADMDRMIETISNKEEINKIIDVIQLDDGFQLNTGDWIETREVFGEKDLSQVAKKISQKGYTPGLWVRSLATV